MRIDGFGQLEASIMERMWSRGPSADVSVREVLIEPRAERDIAYTTVMFTMDDFRTTGWLGSGAPRSGLPISRDDDAGRTQRPPHE